jgi:hypothetical protein
MLLYEMMALTRPFSEKTLLNLQDLVSKGTIPQLPDNVKDKYDQLVPLWKKCLTIDPAGRPSIGECKQELLRLHS